MNVYIQFKVDPCYQLGYTGAYVDSCFILCHSRTSPHCCVASVLVPCLSSTSLCESDVKLSHISIHPSTGLRVQQKHCDMTLSLWTKGTLLPSTLSSSYYTTASKLDKNFQWQKFGHFCTKFSRRLLILDIYR